jgi:hypothetical protein
VARGTTTHFHFRKSLMSGVTLKANMETQRHSFSARHRFAHACTRTGPHSAAGVLGERSGEARLIDELMRSML